MKLLTHFRPHLILPEKIKKAEALLVFSGDIKFEHWQKMGS